MTEVARGSGMAEVVVAGHLCLDVIPDFPSRATLEPGRLSEVGRATFAPGGGVANVGLALGRLGVSTRLLGFIGDDAFGRILKELLEQQDAEAAAGIRVDPTSHTSYTIVVNPPGTDRMFLHHAGANERFEAAGIPPEELGGAKIFYFGYPPLMRGVYGDGGVGLAGLYRRLREQGVVTVMDMTLPDAHGPSGRVDWRAFLERVLPQVDVYLPNFEETLFMLRRRLFDAGDWPRVPGELHRELSGELLGLGAKVAGLTLAGNGIYLRTTATAWPALLKSPAWRGRELYAPAFEVEAVGTTGAGDATVAGFLAAILEGEAPEQALTMAAAVGACCVEAADASSGILSWTATLQRIRRGWPRVDPGKLEGWRRDPSGVYRGPRDGS